MAVLYSLTALPSSQTIGDCEGALGYESYMELRARILKARLDAGMTQQHLADAVKKTRGAVAQWESGEIRPRHSTLRLIAAATGKDIRWLESGIDNANTGMWVVGEVAAGSWKEAAAMLKPYSLPVTPHPHYPTDAQRLYRISGSSVNKLVKDGEYIHCVDVLAADTMPVSGDLVVVKKMEHGMAEYSAKRFLRINGKTILRPESEDPDFQDDLEINGDADTEIVITDIVIAKWSPISRGGA
jgi:transcriptional regulator with XRE-family HTH domain